MDTPEEQGTWRQNLPIFGLGSKTEYIEYDLYGV